MTNSNFAAGVCTEEGNARHYAYLIPRNFKASALVPVQGVLAGELFLFQGVCVSHCAMYTCWWTVLLQGVYVSHWADSTLLVNCFYFKAFMLVIEQIVLAGELFYVKAYVLVIVQWIVAGELF